VLESQGKVAVVQTFDLGQPGSIHRPSPGMCAFLEVAARRRILTKLYRFGGARHDPFVARDREWGPGLSKAKGGALGRTRAGALVSTADARWRELVESADVLSEGSSRLEATGSTWYGSTSLVVALPEATDAERARLLSLANGDPHLRVRVLRLAQREAAARAPAPLGRVVCELRAAADPRGLRFDVDLQAPLIGVRVPGVAPAPGSGGTPPHE
jgi:hypothetical protein